MGHRICLGGLVGLLLFVATAGAWADQALRGHGGPVKSVVVSPDGTQVLSGSFDYSMILWRPGTADPAVRRFPGHDAAVNSVAFLPGATRAVSASDDGMVRLWDLASGRLIKRFEGHSHKVVRIAVSPDGMYAASASWDRTARLWNLQTLEPGPVLKGHSNTINGITFSVDGQFVFTGGYDGEIRQWRVADGGLERLVHRFGWGINVLNALPDGASLLFGALDGSVGVIDIATGNVTRKLPSHDRPVLASVVSAKYGLAATGGGDGVIQVFDIKTWKVKFRHEHAYGPVWGLAVAGDGKSMYFTGLDDHVTYWQMQPDRPFAVAAGNVPRRFQKIDASDPGELQFARKCSICHTLGPDTANRAGPTLFRIFGRKVGSLPGYSYSQTLKTAHFDWNEKTIDQLFAQGPENFLPGTKMPLQKMDNPQDRRALIGYLKRSTGGSAGTD